MITMPNITIKANTWTNLYELCTAITGVQCLPGVATINLSVLSGDAVVYCISATKPTESHGYRAITAGSVMENNTIDPGMWIYSNGEDAIINVYPVNVSVTGFYILPEVITDPVIVGSTRVGKVVRFTAGLFRADDEAVLTTALRLYAGDADDTYVDKPINYVLLEADIGKDYQVIQKSTIAANGYAATAVSTRCKVMPALV